MARQSESHGWSLLDWRRREVSVLSGNKNVFSRKFIFKMDTLSYKTISANKETVHKEWVVVDATDQIVGRLCSKVAKLIRGKYKPNFTPHVDCGDNVIIINAEKVVFSGKKETDKIYTRYTGYPGGQRFNTPAELRKRKDGADRIIRHAVKECCLKVV